MNLDEIGIRIKYCRKKQGYTQEGLAEKINVSPHYIYEIEKGMKAMSLSTLMNLATELNTSTDYLLFGTLPNESLQKMPADNLGILIEQLPPDKRDSVARIIKVTLPLLR